MSGEDKNKISNTTPTINMNDPQSPYYMCSVDPPGNFISPVIFNVENYANWSRIVTNALKSKNTFCFVDGSLTKPGNNNP